MKTKKKTEFQITIGYKAVVTFNIKADTAEQAKIAAMKKIDETGIYDGDIQDEIYDVDGVLDMDKTWNMIR